MINTVSCYQIIEVFPKLLMFSGWNKIVLCIRTRDVSYLCMLYIKLGLPQDGGRETLGLRLTTNSYYVFCGFQKVWCRSEIRESDINISAIKQK